MREMIKQWANRLEALVAYERGGLLFDDSLKFSRVRRPHEYIEIAGHDSSILEVVVEIGFIYYTTMYTRVVWSAHNPPDKPFVFKQYCAAAGMVKPKQLFYDDHSFEAEYLSAKEVEARLCFIRLDVELSQRVFQKPRIYMIR